MDDGRGQARKEEEEAPKAAEAFATVEQKEAQEIRAWIKEQLGVWELSLQQRENSERRSVLGRKTTGQYRQSRQYLKPLERLLKKGSLACALRVELVKIVRLCRAEEYEKAENAYMGLAIGNMAWPVGVTMATFHDRAARHLIGEDQQRAHILNDETQRKYVQVFKRLITLAKERHKAAMWKAEGVGREKEEKGEEKEEAGEEGGSGKEEEAIVEVKEKVQVQAAAPRARWSGEEAELL